MIRGAKPLEEGFARSRSGCLRCGSPERVLSDRYALTILLALVDIGPVFRSYSKLKAYSSLPSLLTHLFLTRLAL